MAYGSSPRWTRGVFLCCYTWKTAQLRRVKLGDIEGDKAVILENLALNDVVALEGFDKLHEGSHVDIAQKDGQSVAPTPDNQLTSNNKAHKKH